MAILVDQNTAQSVVARTILALRARKANLDAGYDETVADSPQSYLDYLARCRDDLALYAEYVFGFVPERHHRIWLRIIQELVEGKLTHPDGYPVSRVLLLAPPNTAKSTYVSQILPPWFTARNPTLPLLHMTSSDTNAGMFDTTYALTFEESERHRLVFPEPEARPFRRKGWSSDKRFLRGMPIGYKDPNFRAVGFGATIVGARAHGIILDDPLDQKQSESAIEQREGRRYYDMTVEPRGQPEGWTLGIMTRWHENDLPGYLIERARNGEGWLVVRMPMLATEEEPGTYDPTLKKRGGWRKLGDPLWPERFPKDQEIVRRKRLGIPTYNCVYQADPIGLGGDVFRDESWFLPLPSDLYEKREDGKSAFERLRFVQAWDFAFSEKDTACYTVGITVGVDSRFNMYILGLFRKKLSTYMVTQEMAKEIMWWKGMTPNRALSVAVEEPAFRMQVTKDIVRQVMHQVFVGVRIIKPTKDKVARAQLVAERAEAGFVYVDRNKPWYPEFIREMLGFPRTTYMDQVDALSLAAHVIYENPTPPKPQRFVISPDGAAERVRRPLILRV